MTSDLVKLQKKKKPDKFKLIPKTYKSNTALLHITASSYKSKNSYNLLTCTVLLNIYLNSTWKGLLPPHLTQEETET